MTVAPTAVPRLAGVHHVKLPVSDLDRSQRWYASRLGYQLVQEFREDGVVMGVVLEHPDGGPAFGCASTRSALGRQPASTTSASGSRTSRPSTSLPPGSPHWGRARWSPLCDSGMDPADDPRP